jgi:hypothetical protein
MCPRSGSGVRACNGVLLMLIQINYLGNHASVDVGSSIAALCTRVLVLGTEIVRKELGAETSV